MSRQLRKFAGWPLVLLHLGCSTEAPVNEQKNVQAKVAEFFTGSEKSLQEVEGGEVQSSAATRSVAVAFHMHPSPISLVVAATLKVELKLNNPNHYLLDPLDMKVASANPAFVTVAPTENRFVFELTAHAAGQAALLATVNGTERSIPVEVLQNKVESLEITPKALRVGALQDMKLLATYTNGNQVDIGENIVWSVQDVSYAAVDPVNPRTILGKRVGEVVVVASYKQPGAVKSQKIASPLQVLMPAIQQLEVVPYWLDYPTDRHKDGKNEAILVGRYETYKAMATFRNGKIFDVSSSVVWSAGLGGEAEVDQVGNVTARKSGLAEVLVEYGESKGQRQITIKQQEVSKIELNPSEIILVPEGYTREVKLDGTLPDSTLAAMAAWSKFEIADGTVAEIVAEKPALVYATSSETEEDSSSSDTSQTSSAPPVKEYILVKGLTKGAQTTLTATYDKHETTAEIRIIDAVIREIKVEAEKTEVFCGQENLIYKATGLYSNGEEEDLTGVVSWSVLDATLANISSDPENAPGSMGHVTTVLDGSTKVMATYVEPFSGDTLTAVQDLVIRPPQVVGVELQFSVAGDAVSIAEGESLKVSGKMRLGCATADDQVDVSSFLDYALSHSGGASCSLSIAADGTIDSRSCDREALAAPLGVQVSAVTNDSNEVAADLPICADVFATTCAAPSFALRPKEINDAIGIQLDGGLATSNATLNQPYYLQAGGNTWASPVPFTITYTDNSKDVFVNQTVTDLFAADKYGKMEFVLVADDDTGYGPCAGMRSTDAGWSAAGCPVIDATTGLVTSGSVEGKFALQMTYLSNATPPKLPVEQQTQDFHVYSECPSVNGVIVDDLFCWYLSSPGQSCDSICAAEGGSYHAFATESHVGKSALRGYADNQASCKVVLDTLLGNDATTFAMGENTSSQVTGSGCFYFDDPTLNIQFYRINTHSDTSGSASFANARRACACKK
ncbi:MAG: hypothetical protein OXT67_14145 [Zetaproteobacteria bacterium]|nr:hypothetical protein [Zetaproteobacteria bacterium]